jgi:GntR family transcriptional regulator/MocR family aminotransferase
VTGQIKRWVSLIAAAGFIAEGHLAHHVRKMRDKYKRRRRLLLDSLQQELSEWLDPIPSFYGTHIAAVARTAVDLDRTAKALLQANVKIHSLSRYYLGPETSAGLVFGYGAADAPEMTRGLASLRKTLEG